MTQWVDTAPKPSSRSAPILALLKQAAAQRTDDIQQQRRLAEALTAARDRSAAIAAWRRVIAATPHDAAAWRHSAGCCWKTDKCRRLWKHLSNCAPGRRIAPTATSIWGAHCVIGARDAADRAMDRAIALSPDDPMCIRTVGRRLLQAGMGAALAEHTFAAADRVGWNTRLLDHLLAAHALQGHSAEVASMLNYNDLVRQQMVIPLSLMHRCLISTPQLSKS